jgi:hypothetical protein
MKGKFLIAHLGADPYALDKKGLRPHDHAKKSKKTAISEWFLNELEPALPESCKPPPKPPKKGWFGSPKAVQEVKLWNP